VAEPSCSTSGGQFGGSEGPGLELELASVVAAMVAVDLCEVCSPLASFVDGRGFQFRNAVQTLQGFPSGPITMPGDIVFFESEVKGVLPIA